MRGGREGSQRARLAECMVGGGGPRSRVQAWAAGGGHSPISDTHMLRAVP